MDLLFSVNWHDLFVPSGSLLEIIIRGTVMYLGLLLLLRIIRRHGGGLGLADVLVIVLIADASQNAMAGEYKSIPEGMVLVGTIAGWDYFFDWLTSRFPRLEKMFCAAPLLLVEDGRMLRRNMRREMITVEELQTQLRMQGLEDFSRVKRCFLESDGQISVITHQARPAARSKNKTGVTP